MTLFEYISIATSLVLSFSLARTLSNIAPIFLSEHRYWVHSLWVLTLLISHASLFWQIWLFQVVEAWTLLEFVLLLTGPVLLLVGASLLVPLEPVSDYRAYFESIRVPYYLVLVLLNIQTIPLLHLMFDVPLVGRSTAGPLVVVTSAAIALALRHPLADKVLVCFWFLAGLASLVSNNDPETMRSQLESLQR